MCNNSYIFATFCIPGISNLTAISVHIATVFFLFLFSFMPLLNKIGFSPFSCNNSILLPFVNDTLVYCISMGSTVFPSDSSSCCFGESCWNILFRSHLFFVPFPLLRHVCTMSIGQLMSVLVLYNHHRNVLELTKFGGHA